MNEGKKNILNGSQELLKKLIKDKKALVIVIIGIVGMLLILLSGIGNDKTDEIENMTEEAKPQTSATQLTTELEALLSKIEGAGRVSAMITLESYDETVYAKNKSENIENSKDSEYKSKTDNEYVIIESGSDETGLKEKVIYPKIRGVAVICDGADNPIISERIISVVTALFDISSANVSVAGMAE